MTFDRTVYQYRYNVLFNIKFSLIIYIAQRKLTEKQREIFCVDMELYQHSSQPSSIQNLLYYNAIL